MNRYSLTIYVKGLFFCLLLFALQTARASAPANKHWWNAPYPETFDSASLIKQPSFIRVDGNNFVDDSGKPFVFRGVNIGDPAKLSATGHWKKSLFAEAKNWGANVIRLPVHPTAWRQLGTSAYFELIDQAVVWANALDLYLIVDWHSIGNLGTEMYQHPMYDTTLKETRDFWRQVAFRYKGIATMAVYEIFNEPTRQSGKLGDITWDRWREINEDIISIIYAHDSTVIPLVAGFNWAYDLRAARTRPVRANGIAYAAHPYPMKSKKPIAEKSQDWEEYWGFLANRYPMIATEIGWMRPGLKGAHVPVMDDGSYGPAIIDYLDSKQISWTVWCFDPDWPPQMISDWNYTPTEQGKFFQRVMRQHNGQ